ncbi:VOC family protein [Rhodopseudomonas pseudopalustris]|uniref:Glyoxalase-like domain-containing protein n=1 Tax=Rhodopseudomonas pseudopalustris TaxID=1513892 RepID=A0A1H8RSF1_9BRAD|nr:VOC family protein [Rhodopseudomonas pseudopalustris]MBB1093713.1 VOC family protein [Rhodopseudomonas palustris]SEO69300.1 Glyoxalase-like domain-containing protein [Rhodopseudomonas pseudopalustris]
MSGEERKTEDGPSDRRPAITAIDHLVVLVSDLPAAVAAYRTLLGRAPAWHGAGDGSQNVLFTLDNMSLELMAPAGAGGNADRIRTVIKLQGEGLASLCFRVSDIGRMHRRLERLAMQPDPVAEVEASDTQTGATLTWKRTRAATHLTRGVRLFFLELDAERPHSEVTAPAPATAMDHIVISTTDSERAAALYGSRLGLDMALDRSHQEWGRLMFFRCGDLTVEVVHRPVAGSDADNDKLWGISWRVDDLDAARARLIDAGVTVTVPRAGRKPGTRVVTVRSGTCHIPTLLVEIART